MGDIIDELRHKDSETHKLIRMGRAIAQELKKRGVKTKKKKPKPKPKNDMFSAGDEVHDEVHDEAEDATFDEYFDED